PRAPSPSGLDAPAPPRHAPLSSTRREPGPRARRHRLRDPSRAEGRLPARLTEACKLEVELLPGHAGDDAADAGSAAEVLAVPGDHRRLTPGRVAEAERGQHGEQDAAVLSEGARGHGAIMNAARARDSSYLAGPSPSPRRRRTHTRHTCT